MLWTLFEKNLVSTMTQQGWTRELYGISAALTKMRFGIGGSAVDRRIFATLKGAGLTENPPPELNVRFPDNLRDAQLLQSALVRAQTIDLPPPAPADVHGDYSDLTGFAGEDPGLGTYSYLAFRTFGVNVPALTYLYFVIVTASLVLYGIGHWRSVGAMAAVVAVTLALYAVVCADIVNFFASIENLNVPGIDLKDPRFLGTIAAVPLLHVIVMWTRPRYRLGPLDYIVVALQAAIFAFALQIRSPVVWAVLALSAFWLMTGVLALCRGRSLRSLCDWRQSRSALMPVVVLAVLFSAQLLAAASLHPLYRAQGDVPRHMFWQGLLSSLQRNPEWAVKYRSSVGGYRGDSMPEEVARIAIMKLPPEERQQYLRSDGWSRRTALEKFSRLAFFDFLRNDPKFVVHTFFIVKPMDAFQSEQQFFLGLFSGLPIWNVRIPAAAVVFLVLLAVWNADARATLLSTAGVIPFFIIVSWLPNWLVLANPLVMIDNFVWMVVFLVLSLVIAAAAVIRCFRYLRPPRKPVTSSSAASEDSAAASGREKKTWLASCSAFADDSKAWLASWFAFADARKAWLAPCSAFVVALLLLGAMLWTSFEKNLVNSLTQQGWTRELYGISAALTKLRFGIGGSAIDPRLFGTLIRNGLTDQPNPAFGVRYPDNLRNAKILQGALLRAQTIDLPPPTSADAKGEYIDLIGFSGEDTGLGTYNYLAFRIFGVNIPALTYLYFLIATASLVLYGIGHWRSVGAMAAVVAVTLALYMVVCADFVNFLGSSAIFGGPGIDVKDPRFLGTLAAIPVLHVIVIWTRPGYRLGPLDYVVVALQAAIFAFALQIRSPVIWAVLAMSAFWLTVTALTLRRGRSLRSLWDWRQSRSALIPIAVLAVVFSAQLLAAATVHPLYRAQGDVPRHMFWQGLLSSLQLNPEWDKKYGAAADNYTDDMMPEAVARIAIMKLPPEERQQYLRRDTWPKRTALEKFTRLAFFDFLRNDPKFVAHTFFIDKPARAWRSERQFFGGLFSGLPIWNALIPAAAVLFLVGLVAWNADAFGTLLPTAGVIPFFIVVAWLPNWLVTLNPMVMIDNFVWIVVFLVLSLVIAAAAAIRCSRYLLHPGNP